MSPSWSSAKPPHGSSIASGPVLSPPLALRWSIVMQRKSSLKTSIALMTAVGQLLMRELRPPPGSDQKRESRCRPPRSGCGRRPSRKTACLPPPCCAGGPRPRFANSVSFYGPTRLRREGARICLAGHRTDRSPGPDDHPGHRRAARRHQPLGRHREQDGRPRRHRPDDGGGGGGLPRGRAGHGADTRPGRLRGPSGGAHALGRRWRGPSGALPSRHGAPGRNAGRQPAAHRRRQGLRTRHLRHEGRCVDRAVGDPAPLPMRGSRHRFRSASRWCPTRRSALPLRNPASSRRRSRRNTCW